MRGVLWCDSLRYGAVDEDELTAMIELGRRCTAQPQRLALASTRLDGFRAGLVVEALGLPAATFCLQCTTPVRAGLEALRALGSGLVLAADDGVATALLVGEGSAPVAEILAERSAVSEYPGLSLGAPGYAKHAYQELIHAATSDLSADQVVESIPALIEAFRKAASGERVLLVTYTPGSAADALLVQKGG